MIINPNFFEYSETLTAERYFDKDYHLIESNWQFAANVDDFKYKNYLCINLLNERIVLTKTDQIRAFYNVCSHKAASVVENNGKNNTDKFRCPYHGWSYDLNGNLIGCPEFNTAKCFDKKENGLKSVDLKIVNGFIFVLLENNIFLPPQPIEEIFKKINIRNNLVFHSSDSFKLNCNWKVFVDNYLDGGYHVNYIHENLAKSLDYKNYEIEIHEKSILQKSPTKGDNSVRSGDAYYWWIFPNFMINIYDNVMDINVVLPTGQETCEVRMYYYFAKDFSYNNILSSIDVARKVQEEDIKICEDVQRGLRSRAYKTGRFGDRERGIWHFHNLLSC